METAYLQAGKVDPLEENANVLTLGVFLNYLRLPWLLRMGVTRL